jgi:hypothetical protein
MIGLILLTIVVVAVTMFVMAVGAIFSSRCLRGSCGGPEVLDRDGTPLTCDTCPLSRRSQHPSGTVAHHQPPRLT